MTCQTLQMLGAMPLITITNGASQGLRFAVPVDGRSIEFLQKLTSLLIVVEPIVLQIFTLTTQAAPVRSHSSVAKRASMLDDTKTRHLETAKVADNIPDGVAGQERCLVRLVYAAVDIQQLQTFLQRSVFSADEDLETEFGFVQRSGDWYVSIGYLKDDADMNRVDAWRVLIRQLVRLAERRASDFKAILSRVLDVRSALVERNSSSGDCVKPFLEALELEDVSYCLKLLNSSEA